MINHPPRTQGLRHIALFVVKFEACLDFYTHILGMTIEWQPDDNNVFLTSGNDNLALHRVLNDHSTWSSSQHLDHMGFILAKPDDVDAWYTFMCKHHVPILAKPKTHRDGAKSFYCADPEGVAVQMIYHPPLSSSL